MTTENKVINEGYPVFPLQSNGFYAEGIWLRDYFATNAIICAVAICTENRDLPPTAELIAEKAYAIADAMIKERVKGI